jgi:Rieske Fe-S protein
MRNLLETPGGPVMTRRPDPHADHGDPARPAAADAADAGRRTLLRGAALLGIAGVTGTLGACGGGGGVTSAAGPPADPVAPAAPAPAGRLPTKSEVYRRTPEPHPRKAKVAADAAVDPATPTDIPGPPPREADLKPAAAKADAKAAAKAAEPAPAAPTTKAGGAQPAARAPRDGKPAKGQPPAPTATPAAPQKATAETLTTAKASDIPVGGGRIFTREKVVVTQPTKGDFKGFSAMCTHQGCLVGDVAQGSILCLCHGSRFSVADGSVQRGPAFLPLAPEKISVTGDTIQRG